MCLTFARALARVRAFMRACVRACVLWQHEVEQVLGSFLLLQIVGRPLLHQRLQVVSVLLHATEQVVEQIAAVTRSTTATGVLSQTLVSYLTSYLIAPTTGSPSRTRRGHQRDGY